MAPFLFEILDFDGPSIKFAVYNAMRHPCFCSEKQKIPFSLSLYRWILGYISFCFFLSSSCYCYLCVLFVRKICIKKTCLNDILCESANYDHDKSL